MLTPDKISNVAKNAAYVAYTVLGLDCPYSVEFINKPELPFDGLLSHKDNTCYRRTILSGNSRAILSGSRANLSK